VAQWAYSAGRSTTVDSLLKEIDAVLQNASTQA